MPQLTVCPSCAEHLEPEDKFCGNCGTSVADDDATTAVPAAPAAAPGSKGGTRARDYGLAPPVPKPAVAPAQPAVPYVPPQPPQAAPPPQPPQTSRAERLPRAGIADPRQEMLLTEPEPPREDPAPAPPAADAPDASAGATPSANGTAEAAEPAATQPAAGSCVACGDGVVDADGYCARCGHAQPRERDHIERELAAVAAVTDRGLRHHRNEDAFGVTETPLPDGTPAVIAVVCDGVSSATRPDEASEAAAVTAIATLTAALSGGTEPRQAMHDTLLAAADAVSALCPPEDARDPHRNAPACTCVSAVITGDVLTVGWIGDSRVYWVPQDRDREQPARLTEDDSWAARMVEAGLMGEEEAYADARAHAITGWLGADAVELDPHTASFQLERPGVVIVCTDGLWNYAESAEQLAAVVPADAREHPLRCAQTLVGVALDGGGHDNVTVAVLPFPAPGTGAGSV